MQRIFRILPNGRNVRFRFDSWKVDTFGRRIGILNRFFAIRFSLKPILYRQNRDGMDEPFGALEFWNWWPFFFRNLVFSKNRMKMLLEIVVILVIIFITVFSKNVYGFSVFYKVFFKKPYENIVVFSYSIIC